MRNTHDDGRRMTPQPENEPGGRGSQKRTGHFNSPGGDGSQERIPAKGNDLTREDDLLQNDINDELDDMDGTRH